MNFCRFKTLFIVFVISLVQVTPLFARGARKMADKTLAVADFDSGTKPNNLGGDFGAWNRDPRDPSQFCNMSFFKEDEPGNYSLKLDYDVDSMNPAYNGFWMKLEGADFSKYKYFVISVRGDKAAGYPKKVILELKNKEKQVGRCYLTKIGNNWGEVAIPLKSFLGLRNLKEMDEFVLVFDDIHTFPQAGTIYIDKIYLR